MAIMTVDIAFAIGVKCALLPLVSVQLKAVIKRHCTTLLKVRK